MFLSQQSGKMQVWFVRIRGVQVGFFKSSQASSQVKDSEILSSQVRSEFSQVKSSSQAGLNTPIGVQASFF